MTIWKLLEMEFQSSDRKFDTKSLEGDEKFQSETMHSFWQKIHQTVPELSEKIREEKFRNEEYGEEVLYLGMV